MQVLVAGGTGTAGRVLVARSLSAGHQVRVLTREAGPAGSTVPGAEVVVGDLTTGAGLDVAVAGTDAVVDLTNIDTARRRTASRFFTTGTRHLVAAEERAGVGHHLTLSIVGVDRVPSGYYRAKVDQEAAVVSCCEAAGIGHTIARVTQFHDFAATVLRRFRVGPVVLAPPLHVQPVHLAEVADHLLGLLEAEPQGYAEELGGPAPEELTDMTRRLARATGAHVPVVPLPLPPSVGRADRQGALRPVDGRRGRLGFQQWLEELP